MPTCTRQLDFFAGVTPIRVGLIACAKGKGPRAVMARDLYNSPLFKGSLDYVEARCILPANTYVLSAMYGLLPVARVVPPYDLELKDLSREQQDAWGLGVTAALLARYGSSRLDILLMAGLQYRRPIRWQPQWSVTDPMDRLEIGDRLRFLKEDRLSRR